MKLIYTSDKVELVGNSIFLAGPTPRSSKVPSWRPKAIEKLASLNFPGTVLVPEGRNWVETLANFNFKDQVEWEWQGLENCSAIVFWVPREIDTMPAFTTNVEFGSYVRSGRAYYGRPDNSEKKGYLDWLYKKTTGRDHFNNLDELLTYVVFLLER